MSTPFHLQFMPGPHAVFIRELCGRDELAVEDLGTVGAIGLLNSLLVNPEATGTPLKVKAEQMVTADRDRLMAWVYQQTYGPTVPSTVHCQYCSEPFDLDFSLEDLQAHMQPEFEENALERFDDGSFCLANGPRFRLPCGEDEFTVMGLPLDRAEQVLLVRCLLEGNPASDGERVQQAMAQIAPVLQREMKAFCPECGREQPVYFNMQSFLLTRLRSEQKQVAGEVHRLATAYRWSHQEILDLPRRLRRTYVALIESEGHTA
jgi:hypothetical protein